MVLNGGRIIRRTSCCGPSSVSYISAKWIRVFCYFWLEGFCFDPTCVLFIFAMEAVFCPKNEKNSQIPCGVFEKLTRLIKFYQLS